EPGHHRHPVGRPAARRGRRPRGRAGRPGGPPADGPPGQRRGGGLGHRVPGGPRVRRHHRHRPARGRRHAWAAAARNGPDMITLPRVGLGTAPIGNLYTAVTDADARATVEAACECGVRLFDTAPHYALGLAERRLGEAPRGRAGCVLSTKVGRLLVPSDRGGRDDEGFDVPDDRVRVWDFSRDGVLRSLEESLDRLGLPGIDLALIHDPDAHVDQAITEAYPALAGLRAQGVVKAV